LQNSSQSLPISSKMGPHSGNDLPIRTAGAVEWPVR
jgi:hypothetical protein